MKCPIHRQPDPFQDARRKDGVLVNEFAGDPVPMILRHPDLREACNDWQTYSSDAPMRVPIPSEEKVRTVRQLPLEIDPPEHGEYRKLVEPFFARAKLPEVMDKVETLIRKLIQDATQRESIDVIPEIAIPLQSRALAYLLNMPDSEADVWIGWGTHVFREGDGEKKGADLEAYMNLLFDRGEKNPGEDFFSALANREIQGRKLTREECLGYSSIMFAGGRDTVINSITGVIGYLSKNQQAFEYLRQDPKRITNASEEFFRAISPVTHIARVCPSQTEIHGVQVVAGKRISICFASANYDETIFPSPEEVRLDRKPNPHVAFGYGPHLCLGAAHARMIIRTLIRILCENVQRMDTLSAVEKVENEPRYQRTLSFDRLEVRFTPMK